MLKQGRSGSLGTNTEITKKNQNACDDLTCSSSSPLHWETLLVRQETHFHELGWCLRIQTRLYLTPFALCTYPNALFTRSSICHNTVFRTEVQAFKGGLCAWNHLVAPSTSGQCQAAQHACSSAAVPRYVALLLADDLVSQASLISTAIICNKCHFKWLFLTYISLHNLC